MILVFVFICLQLSAYYEQKRGNDFIEILEVKFEPIKQGKNEVKIKVENLSTNNQVFVLDVQTSSPDYGKGMGWGRQFFFSIPLNENKWTSTKFKIQGPVTEKTVIRLTYYNPPSREEFDYKKPFFTETFLGKDLTHYVEESGMLKKAPKEQEEKAKEIFLKLQDYIKNRNYEKAWLLFSEEYKAVELNHKFDNFKSAMDMESIWSRFLWRRDQFVELIPKSVYLIDEKTVISASRGNEMWKIDIKKEDENFKIDWIRGYTPAAVRQANWETTLLPKLESLETASFRIFFYKDSTAAKDIQKIIKQRENALQKISDFLDQEQDISINLIFFEDEQTKQWETGHQGMGWAFKTTIVEVYNEEAKLDPYHELVHILMREIGNPPALFNEGFAVYMSEKLGAPALKHLGGELKSINARFTELWEKNQSVDLEELITFTEIGSEESKPPIAYPQAASFTKFLIEKYGKEKFLTVFQTLKNSNDDLNIQDNLKKLEEIYGQSFLLLKNQWETSFKK